MFQKLYKHLEEMNESLRQDKGNSAESRQLASKISEQLESVGKTILLQNSLLASQQKLIEAEKDQTRRGLTPVLQVANLFISCVGIVVIIFFSIYTFQLSRITRSLVNSQAAAAGRSLPVTPSSVRSSPRIDNGVELQSHLAKLDSLISEQTQSLQELKKLNAVAVRTFIHIRRRLDRSDLRSQTNTTMADSLSLAR